MNGLEGNIRYQAITSGKADVIDALETDAILKKMDLEELEDDIEFLPPYQACVHYQEQKTPKNIRSFRKADMMEGAITKKR